MMEKSNAESNQNNSSQRCKEEGVGGDDGDCGESISDINCEEDRPSKNFKDCNTPINMTTTSEVTNTHRFYYHRKSTSSPDTHSPRNSPLVSNLGEESGLRSLSNSSASSSPAPANGSSHRRNSVGPTDSTSTSSNGNNNNSRHTSLSTCPSSGAIPLTKNVGVSVNFGKANVKSNSSSSAGAQHIIPNGHQHQHTPVTTASTASSSNNHNNGNSAAINLGHGHIGTIAGPPSVSISSGGGPSSGSIGVSYNSSLSTSPAAIAPTTCTNKGVPSTHNQQQQHLSIIPSPQLNTFRLSPHSPSPGLPMNHVLPELFQQGSTTGANNTISNSSSSSSSSSRNGGSNGSTSSGNSTGGIRTGPNSPSPSGGSKRGTQTTSSSASGGGLLTQGSTGFNGASTSSSTSTAAGSKSETPNPSKCAESSGTSGSNSANKIVSQNVNGTCLVTEIEFATPDQLIQRPFTPEPGKAFAVKSPVAVTGVPSNESEIQLFRVLQRANLLSYFDVMIELGGDDVQQLCDAGEDEFLEIMALIGMASKPLHVRRLQKALQEWMTQPSLFQSPVLPPGFPVISNTSMTGTQPQPSLPHLAVPGVSGVGPIRPVPYNSVTATTAGIPALYPPGITGPLLAISESKSLTSSKTTNHLQLNGIRHISANSNSPSGNSSLSNCIIPALALQDTPSGLAPDLAAVLSSLSPNNNNHHQQHQSRYNHHHNHSHSNGLHTSNKGHCNTSGYEKEKGSGSSMSISEIKIPADQLIPSHFLEAKMRTRSEPNSPASSIAGSPHPESHNSVSPIPSSLQDHEVQKLADAAIHLIRSLPPSVAEPKFSSKKKTSGDYELILRLSDHDSRRMEEVRRVAAVYGRPDAKRKTLKPLSLHELAINEAAAQLCKHVPALLTKREELLSLSRQVLRDSGLPYAAISSTFSISLLTNGPNSNHNNSDIITKSKYDDITGINRSFPLAEGRNHLFSGGFHANKRFRLDAPSGIEIQEYSPGRLPSTHGSPSPPTTTNGMQITELRSLPLRRSPLDDHLPTSPLELVTVTTSDLRKSGISSAGSGSKSSSVSSMDSISPPIRRPFATQSEDLNSSSGGSHHGMRINQAFNTVPSIKITSIPVNGGSISIMNHSGTAASGTGTNHHFNHHHYNSSQQNGMKLIPIKSEPTVN